MGAGRTGTHVKEPALFIAWISAEASRERRRHVEVVSLRSSRSARREVGKWDSEGGRLIKDRLSSPAATG